jgi:ribokinase
MITVLGSLNMDLFIEAPRFPSPGETILGRNFSRACGGKGATQAYAAARMGHPTALLGAIGQDSFGNEMLEPLHPAGVDTTGVLRRPNVPSGIAMIVLAAERQNQIVVGNGANETFDVADVRRCGSRIGSSDALLVQLETPVASVRAALEIARGAGKLTALNPAPFAPLEDQLLQLCDFVISNENEASLLSGVPVHDLKSAAAAAARIRDRTHGNVLVTLGANGVWIETPNAREHLPGFQVAATDTVGAGDAFIGSLVVRLIVGTDIRQGARFACATAAIAVTRRGAQAGIPTRMEVQEWLSNTHHAAKVISGGQTRGAG